MGDQPDITEVRREQRGSGIAAGDKMAAFLGQLTEEQRVSAEAAMNEKSISTMAVMRVFRRWGAEIGCESRSVPGATAIANWRRDNGGG